MKSAPVCDTPTSRGRGPGNSPRKRPSGPPSPLHRPRAGVLRYWCARRTNKIIAARLVVARRPMCPPPQQHLQQLGSPPPPGSGPTQAAATDGPARTSSQPADAAHPTDRTADGGAVSKRDDASRGAAAAASQALVRSVKWHGRTAQPGLDESSTPLRTQPSTSIATVEFPGDRLSRGNTVAAGRHSPARRDAAAGPGKRDPGPGGTACDAKRRQAGSRRQLTTRDRIMVPDRDTESLGEVTRWKVRGLTDRRMRRGGARRDHDEKTLMGQCAQVPSHAAKRPHVGWRTQAEGTARRKCGAEIEDGAWCGR